MQIKTKNLTKMLKNTVRTDDEWNGEILNNIFLEKTVYLKLD